MARKHFSQFTPDELGFATGFVRKQIQPRVSGSPHFTDRGSERRFTLDDARETLRTGIVVEVHNDRGDWRALVRSKNGTCVVVSLESARVLTVYYNDPADKHETLNRSVYASGAGLCVVTVVKMLFDQRRGE